MCGKCFTTLQNKKGAILKLVQNICGKKPYKMLKAATTRWLTHGRASKRILDCFHNLMETKNTAVSEARASRALLTYKVLPVFTS